VTRSLWPVTISECPICATIKWEVLIENNKEIKLLEANSTTNDKEIKLQEADPTTNEEINGESEDKAK
jgi:hypothetical protein